MDEADEVDVVCVCLLMKMIKEPPDEGERRVKKLA